MGERLEERRKDTIRTCYTHIWKHAIHIYGNIMVKSGNRHNYVSVMIR